MIRNEQLARLRDLEAWSLRGRIALSAGGDSFSGSLFWRQDEDAVDLQFRAPLGLGGFTIQGDDDLIEVQLKSGETFSTADPTARLEREFGWPFPVRSLRYWVLGLPDPNARWNESLTPAGMPRRLDQNGWVVEYDRFERVEETLLPTRVKISGEGVRIKVAVHRWELDYTSAVPLEAAVERYQVVPFPRASVDGAL